MDQDKKDYGKTLNLPQTDFAMRGNLPKKEPQILKYWEDIDIYEQVAQANAGKPKFILHDGPPYANGDIHLGHALNKVLKDIIVKQRSQVGFDAPYVPGWDTHGLPIELKAIKKLGLDHHNVCLLYTSGMAPTGMIALLFLLAQFALATPAASPVTAVCMTQELADASQMSKAALKIIPLLFITCLAVGWPLAQLLF